ncbi:MAG TPA: hypothetical protein VK760_13525 [Candidatus Acidoferrales bacterium]|jgi:hypothetical protein|nr:hypothetical protein [Candidatus Acidoferrales bacterium]
MTGFPMPTNRLPTILLAAGAAVLLLAILLGERMGDRVLGQVARGSGTTLPVAITPEPLQTAGPFGADWKRSMTLTAAPDPRFPDPRVPPQPLPTRAAETPAPVSHTPTPNPNIPVWRQQPMPTVAPIAIPTEEPTAAPVPVSSSPPFDRLRSTLRSPKRNSK